MCTWNGCPQAATVTLGFGRVNDLKQPDPDGRLLLIDYCDTHAALARVFFNVEHDGPVLAGPVKRTREPRARTRPFQRRQPVSNRWQPVEHGLSASERYHLALAESGCGVPEIALLTGRLTETVKGERQRILQRLRVRGITHAVATWIRVTREPVLA